jgi:hypothetical protein
MSIQTIIAIAAASVVIWASEAWASCRRVAVPEIIGVAVFKHYRTDGGEVVDIVGNRDVVVLYGTLGSKAKVRKLQVDKVRLAGWVPRDVLMRRPVPCVANRGSTQDPGTRLPLLDLLKPLQSFNPAQ